VTGVPGVGKSSFIEVFGGRLLDEFEGDISTFYELVIGNTDFLTYLYIIGSIVIITIDNELILCRVEARTDGRAYDTGIYDKGKYGGYCQLKVIKRGLCKSQQTEIVKDKILRGNLIVSANINGSMISNSTEIKTINDNNEIVFKGKNEGLSYIKIDKAGTGGLLSVGDIYSNNYMIYQQGNSLVYENGFNIEAKYINKTAYCINAIDFIGALDTSKLNIFYDNKAYINPFYSKTITNIILTTKDNGSVIAYDLSKLNINHFGTANEIIPQENISEISSIYGGFVTTLNCNNFRVVLNYGVNINSIRFENLGYGDYAILVNSQDVLLHNLRFKNLKKTLYGTLRTGSYFYNNVIESFSSSVELISNFLKVYNISININNGINPLFYRCSNIYNLTLTANTSSNFYDLIMFYQCKNINNVRLYDLDLKQIALDCVNISNIQGNFITDRKTTLTSYLFDTCKNLSNINYTNPDYFDKWFKDCSYLNNISTTTNSGYNTGLTKVDTNTVSWT
jgi:hypothetical protein